MEDHFIQINQRDLPGWVPQAACNYLRHTGQGQSMRLIARQNGCHASTVLRQIRKVERLRDDKLVDLALQRLERRISPSPKTAVSDDHSNGKERPMSTNFEFPGTEKTAAFERDALIALRNLTSRATCLAVADNMEKAVIVKDMGDGNTQRVAVIDREVAEVMALKGWIRCDAPGRISRYDLTADGRSALIALTAQAENKATQGFAEAQLPFDFQDADTEDQNRPKPNNPETPLSVLARRRDKTGVLFLSAELVAAGERLREDFELSKLGGQGVADWSQSLKAHEEQDQTSQSRAGAEAARGRVAAALQDLGPGLGDAVLQCCCYLEGLENTEKRMGWSARSGKIVLRIALERLRRHYDALGEDAAMIG